MKKLLASTILLFALLTSTQAASDASMSITDTNGKTYKVTGTEQGLKIKGLEGKIVFLDFFGHKCPPCLKSIPHLIKLQKKYKNKLAIVAIEVQGYNNSQLKSFAKEKGINYITVSDEKANGIVNYISQRAQWQGSIPFLVAMDKKGDVQFVQAGMLPEASLEELIRQLDAIK
ncbi:MAG TPA: TlpA family protein disulfide reductase [Sulfurimonas autotrophica]|nr:TlpA family protein disulfide reductase [Sulfurimonas autotrophica]